MIRFINARLDGEPVHQWLNVFVESVAFLEGTMLMATCPSCGWGYYAHDGSQYPNGAALEARAARLLATECPDHLYCFWLTELEEPEIATTEWPRQKEKK